MKSLLVFPLEKELHFFIEYFRKNGTIIKKDDIKGYPLLVIESLDLVCAVAETSIDIFPSDHFWIIWICQN